MIQKHMISLFSNYLEPFINEGLLQDVEQKPSNIYEQLRIAYNQGASVIYTTRYFVPYYEGMDLDEYEYDLLHEIWRNEDLNKIVYWFNYKIIPEFETLDYRAKAVRLRIAVNMIFKLVENGKLRRDYAIRLHANLAKTLWDEHSLLINEDLPF